MLRELAARTRRPIIVVLIHGGPIDISALVGNPRVGAVLTAWYPAQGVMAIPNVLLGVTPPSGVYSPPRASVTSRRALDAPSELAAEDSAGPRVW